MQDALQAKLNHQFQCYGWRLAGYRIHCLILNGQDVLFSRVIQFRTSQRAVIGWRFCSEVCRTMAADASPVVASQRSNRE